MTTFASLAATAAVIAITIAAVAAAVAMKKLLRETACVKMCAERFVEERGVVERWVVVGARHVESEREGVPSGHFGHRPGVSRPRNKRPRR